MTLNLLSAMEINIDTIKDTKKQAITTTIAGMPGTLMKDNTTQMIC